jgi:hypothetical protein
MSDVVLNLVKFEESITKTSLCLIDEFLMSNYAFYKMNPFPILVVVVDSIKNTEETLSYLRFFQENISKVYSGKI